ncbi:hypothetical protein BS50DRAFT_572864 [Corynespora cassiicola Philippines]|uniref:Uncharacterized protein n=1 Tax=Corynespora cassiicola Philippines TaxID=1448308 RepID=A0A2T2NS26_CORCC|nr:hypothetical protein BS50DRAFT_572864 [Corynespora cassiicola Philippines]
MPFNASNAATAPFSQTTSTPTNNTTATPFDQATSAPTNYISTNSFGQVTPTPTTNPSINRALNYNFQAGADVPTNLHGVAMSKLGAVESNALRA